jgi:hypothetical protein
MSTARSLRTGWRAFGYAGMGLLALGGCTALRPVKEPGDYIESVQPKVVRLTKSDGSQIVMVGARLQNDTLMGFVAHRDTPVGVFEEVPFNDVAKVEAQQWAGDRTVVAITAGALVWAGFTYLVVRHVENSNP